MKLTARQPKIIITRSLVDTDYVWDVRVVLGKGRVLTERGKSLSASKCTAMGTATFYQKKLGGIEIEERFL